MHTHVQRVAHLHILLALEAQHQGLPDKFRVNPNTLSVSRSLPTSI